MLASLFSKFGDQLIRNELLDNISNVRPSCFIKVERRLEKNPIVGILDDYLKLLDISIMFLPTPAVGLKTRAKEEKTTVEKMQTS